MSRGFFSAGVSRGVAEFLPSMFLQHLIEDIFSGLE
jgi:hypothetical protein